MDDILQEPAAKYYRAHEGITKSDFLTVVVDTGMNLTEFSSLLPVSKRTIEKTKNQELLSPAVSDRILQIASLYEHGSIVFGSLDIFKEWLDTPIIALGQKRPKSFIDNGTGISMINDLLGRIEHGVYS